MSYRLLLTEEALQDSLSAYDYYESILPGLGENFLDTLAELFRAISENPFLYSYIDKQKILRDVKLTRFPFVVIFEIVNDTVVVFAVHNTNRQMNL